MATLAGKAYHPVNGSTEEIWEGFSWPCLFLGCLWYLYKGMWGWAVISLCVSIATFGIAWFFFPIFANEHYANSLIKRGYLNEEQWQQRLQASSAKNDPGPQQRESFSIANELQKLAGLKEQGILSDEEFQTAKKKLIG